MQTRYLTLPLVGKKTKRKLHFLILLISAFFNQGLNNQVRKSTRRVLLLAILSLLLIPKLESQTRKVYRAQAFQYLADGKPDSAYIFASRAQTLSKSEHSKADIGILIGRIKKQNSQPSEAMRYYDSLLNSLRNKDIKGYLATALFDYGAVYKSIGDIDKALEVFKESYDLYHQTTDLDNSSKVTGAIANIYKTKGDFASAKEYFHELLAVRQTERDSIGIGVIMNNLGLVYLNQSLPDSALSLFKESLNFRSDKRRKSISLLNVGEAFRLKSDNDSAQYYFKQSWILKEQIKDKKGLITLGNNFAELYLAKGEYDSVHLYLSLSANHIAKNQPLKEEIRNLQLWSQLYEIEGEDAKALDALTRSIELDNDIKRNSAQATQMLIQFAKDRKDEIIQLKDDRLSNIRYINVLLRVSTISLLLVALLLYLLFRSKQKEKKATEWRMREQHHRVGNNIAVLSTLLNQAGNEANSDEAKTLALEGKSRLEAMNLLHNKLYWKNDTANIPLKPYISELTNQILSFYIPYRPNAVQLDLAEVSLPVSQAIPFSLILNEILTNACKYGLQNTDSPKLKIRLFVKDNKLEIDVTNNGVVDNGVVAQSDKHNKDVPSFGHTLIQTLAKQLKGGFTLVLQDSIATSKFEMPY